MSKKIDFHKAALKERHRIENLQWRTLLDCLAAIAQFAPWEKIAPEIPFAFIPQSNDQMIFFSCVQDEDTVGLMVFPSPLDYQYGAMQAPTQREVARGFIEMENYSVCYSPKSHVPDDVLKLYHRLSVDFGDGPWPWVNHKRHGYCPETPHGESLAFLLDCLGNFHMQLLALEDGVPLPDTAKGEMLLRYYAAEDDLWYTTTAPFAIPPASNCMMMLSEEASLLEELRALPPAASVHRMEFDFGWMDEPVQDHDRDTPYFPLNIILTDRQAGTQLALYHCRPEEFFGCAITAFVEALRQYGLPEAVYVCRDECYDLLSDIAKKIGLKLKRVKRLPAAARIFRSWDII